MFFQPSSFKEQTLSMSHFNDWAGEIANSYFNAQVPPTETLCKIAQLEELSPSQIEVLASEANKEIHKHKYASAKDKYFAADFPLADAREAIKSLQADGGGMKMATSMPDPVMADRAPDMFKMFGIDAPVMDKTASLRRELKVASVRGELLEQKTQDDLIMSKFATEAAENVFIKTARQIVLAAETPTARMKTLGTLDVFVKSAGMLAGREPLAKLAHSLGKEGLIYPQHAKIAVEYFTKAADQKAPQELISEWLPAQIVNGEHPLYISLKTFQDCRHNLEDRGDRHKLIQDQLDVVRQKVRAL